MAHDVFISHSSKDKPVADAVRAALEERAVGCWIAPRDIMPGADWSASIVQAIRASRVLLLVFSANANASAQIKREVECAANAGVILLPVRVEDVVPTASLEYFLGNIQWLDAVPPPAEPHLPGVADKVRAILAGGPSADDSPERAAARRSARTAVAARKPRRIAASVAAALVVGLVGAGVWHFIRDDRRGRGGPSAPPRHAHAQAAAATTAPAGGVVRDTAPAGTTRQTDAPAVDPALVGSWDFTTTVGEHELHVQFSFEPSGKYERREFIQKDETLTAEDGKYTSRNAVTGATNAGTYRFVDADTLTMTGTMFETVPGARLTNAYKRVGRKRADNPLVGTWNATTFAFELNWQVQAEIRPDMTCRFLMETRDEGTIKMSGGEWEANSLGSGRRAAGIYRNVTPATMEMNVAGFGIVTLRRLAEFEHGR